jgi:FlaA1/EpsC-like NDP-sugar epimerase
MISEKLLLDAAAKAKEENLDSDFMFVRFGNVLGSRGSVLPLFMSQIQTGGPITVTDKNMQRYFMTIPEACSLVLKTGGVGKNGFSYLLDMGEPIKIIEMAEQCIKFSGLEPYKDVDIVITGLRKGERLDEPLWLDEENPQKTEFPKILKLTTIKESFKNTTLQELIENLYPICYFVPGKADMYRNKELLVKIVKNAIYKEEQ